MSGYFFVPRQCSGGLFPFLAVSAFGIVRALETLRLRVLQSLALASVLALSSVHPWARAVVLNQPPFPDQPRNIVHKLPGVLFRDGFKNILVSDPCTGAAVDHYAQQQWGAPAPSQEVRVRGIRMQRQCYSNSTCVYTMGEADYCSAADALFSPGGKANGLLEECPGRFAVVLYASQRFPASACTAIRTW
jgi:hypothetical protein